MPLARRLRSVARRIAEGLGHAVWERGVASPTSGWASSSGASEDPEHVRYEPSGWLFLRRGLRDERIGPEHVFLDYGAGKGRVLIQAARRPFGRVIGVEHSTALAEVARRNAEATSDRARCPVVTVLTLDAAAFDPPDDVTHAYLFNPFQGRALTRAIEALIASYDRRPRRLRVIYANPMQPEILLATGRVRHVRTSRGLRQTLVARLAPSRLPYEDPSKISVFEVTPPR